MKSLYLFYSLLFVLFFIFSFTGSVFGDEIDDIYRERGYPIENEEFTKYIKGLIKKGYSDLDITSKLNDSYKEGRHGVKKDLDKSFYWLTRWQDILLIRTFSNKKIPKLDVKNIIQKNGYPNKGKIGEYVENLVTHKMQERDLSLRLGICYFFGYNGVIENYTKAEYWLLRAVKAEIDRAMVFLGHVYRKTNNNTQALMWYSRARETFEDNIDLQEYLDSNIKEVSEQIIQEKKKQSLIVKGLNTELENATTTIDSLRLDVSEKESIIEDQEGRLEQISSKYEEAQQGRQKVTEEKESLEQCLFANEATIQGLNTKLENATTTIDGLRLSVDEKESIIEDQEKQINLQKETSETEKQNYKTSLEKILNTFSDEKIEVTNIDDALTTINTYIGNFNTELIKQKTEVKREYEERIIDYKKSLEKVLSDILGKEVEAKDIQETIGLVSQHVINLGQQVQKIEESKEQNLLELEAYQTKIDEILATIKDYKPQDPPLSIGEKFNFLQTALNTYREQEKPLLNNSEIETLQTEQSNTLVALNGALKTLEGYKPQDLKLSITEKIGVLQTASNSEIKTLQNEKKAIQENLNNLNIIIWIVGGGSIFIIGILFLWGNNKRKTFSRQNSDISKKQNELERIQEKNTEQEKKIEAKNSELEKINGKLLATQNTLENTEQKLNSYKEEIGKKESKLEELGKKLITSEKSNSENQGTIETLRLELDKTKKRLERLKKIKGNETEN